MPKASTMELYRERLFDDIDTLPDITDSQKSQLLRYRWIVSRKLERPWIPNTELVTEIKAQFGMKDAQAYRDIRDCEPFMAQIRTAKKEYIRYLVNETQKKALDIAINNEDSESISKANMVLIKANRLDHDDPDPPSWDDIELPDIEYSNKPILMKIENIPDPQAFVEQVKKKYIAQDVEFEEVKNE